jgi:hypothetical protein
MVREADPAQAALRDPYERERPYGVVEKRELPNRRGVLRDEVIFLFKLAQADLESFFRRIEFYDEKEERVLVFLS